MVKLKRSMYTLDLKPKSKFKKSVLKKPQQKFVGVFFDYIK